MATPESIETWKSQFEGDDVRDTKRRILAFAEAVNAAMRRCSETTRLMGTAKNRETKIGFDAAQLALDVRALLNQYEYVLGNYAIASINAQDAAKPVTVRSPVEERMVSVMIPQGSGAVLHIQVSGHGGKGHTLVINEKGLVGRK